MEQRLAERNAITVGDLCREYLAKAEAGLIIGRKGLPKKGSTLEIDRGRIARHIIPLLGKKPLKDLTSADVKRFLEAVTSGKTAAIVKTRPRGVARVTGGATAAVRAVGLLGGMLTYAKEMGYIEHNPAHGIRKPADKRRSFRLAPEGVSHPRRKRSRPPSAGANTGKPTAAIRLLALTGCRRSEILNLKWSEIDFANFLPAARRHENRRLYSTATRSRSGVSWPHSKRSGDYVFPGVSRSDRSYASVFPKAWRRIVGAGYSPHGLRHAYASAAHELGFGRADDQGASRSRAPRRDKRLYRDCR